MFLLKSWAKFFSYVQTPNQVEQPNQFDVNEAYLLQKQQNFQQMTQKSQNQDQKQQGDSSDQPTKDEYGALEIPSENHFFFVLTKKSIYALSARKNDLAKTYKSLELHWLEDIVMDDENNMKGGLEDLGNYQEGYCIKLKSKTRAIWNMCFDNQKDKNDWVEQLQDLIPRKQSSGSNYLQEIQQKQQEQEFPFKINLNPKQNPNDNNLKKNVDDKQPKDGVMMVIQDWSQCTLACGGGRQYQQRICIPPKNGGRPCIGDTILERTCNKQPCPNVVEEQKQEQLEGQASFKMVKISNRYQRFEQCIIKEEDMNLCINRPNVKQCIQFPSRVVLNNKTLTVFTQSDYDSIYKSFDLQYILTQQVPNEKACIRILDQRDKKKEVVVCIMPASVKEGQSYQDKIQEWMKDVYNFGHKCQSKQQKSYNNEDSIKDPALKQKIQQLIEEQKEKDMEDVISQEEKVKEISIEKEVEKTALTAQKAVEKELKYEELALQEEKMREAQEEKQLLEQLEKMKEKKECLERQIKQKEQLSQLQSQNNQLKKKIFKIKQTAQVQIENSRNEVKERIEAMRKQAEKRRRELKSKMQVIRTKMMDTLILENKKGDLTKCNPKQSQKIRNDYCDKLPNNQDSLQNKVDCKLTPQDFCQVCCNNEFGIMVTDERTQCNSQCFDGENNTWINVRKDSKVMREITN